MMYIWKRKHLTVVALLLFVAVAGFVSRPFSGRVEDSSPATAEYSAEAERAEEERLGATELVNAPAGESDYFAKARMDREEGRSRAVETLNTVLQNEGSDEEARAAASAEVSQIAKNSDMEVVVENLIKAKGFSDAVVYIGEDSINVVVKTEGLEPSEVSVIQDVVMGETGCAADKIKITEVSGGEG